MKWSRKFGLWVHTGDPDVVQFRGLLCDFGAEGAQSQLELLPVQRMFNSQLLHVGGKINNLEIKMVATAYWFFGNYQCQEMKTNIYQCSIKEA